ncbi:MAG: hypothetical protein VKI42_08010 [Synechococcaceae cyanobacterium]|nr:hypothetical protein [Synechococcaceae cyanobacterium]
MTEALSGHGFTRLSGAGISHKVQVKSRPWFASRLLVLQGSRH